MIRQSRKTKKTTIETTADRFVTPTVTFDNTYPCKNVGVMFPVPDDASAVALEVAPREHRFNYPCLDGKTKPEGPHGYADNNIIMEWDMDDADGTTITDKVQGIVLTEAGDPAYQQSAATAGLGKGVTYDGTGDYHAYTLSSTVTDPLTLVETGDFSVEIVFKTSANATAANDTLFAIRDGTAGIGFSLVYDGADHVDFHVDDGTEVALAGTTDTDTGNIVHLIGTADRDGNGTIYVNGAAEGAASIAGSPGTLLNESANPKITVGARADASGDIPATVYFIRVYNICLTAAQCLENYRIMMNQGAPGWVPLADPADGDDLAICKAASQPSYFDLSDYKTLRTMAFRASHAVEQTTTPANLDVYWIFE